MEIGRANYVYVVVFGFGIFLASAGLEAGLMSELLPPNIAGRAVLAECPDS